VRRLRGLVSAREQVSSSKRAHRHFDAPTLNPRTRTEPQVMNTGCE
jgi:hypothetical protein